MISSSLHTLPRIKQEARIKEEEEEGRRKEGKRKNESKARVKVQIILQCVGQILPSPQYFL